MVEIEEQKTIQTKIQVILAITLAVVLITSIDAQTDRNSTQDKGNAEILNNQAVELYDIGNFDGAIRLLREAIVLRPDFAAAFGNRGAAFYRSGKIKEAAVAL